MVFSDYRISSSSSSSKISVKSTEIGSTDFYTHTCSYKNKSISFIGGQPFPLEDGSYLFINSNSDLVIKAFIQNSVLGVSTISDSTIASKFTSTSIYSWSTPCYDYNSHIWKILNVLSCDTTLMLSNAKEMV